MKTKSLNILVLFILTVFTQNCADKSQKDIIFINKEGVFKIIPSEYKIDRKFDRIYINDSVKLSFTLNSFEMKSSTGNIQFKGEIISDTLNNRILRELKIKENSPNQFSINYTMTDLYSSQIPKTYGGSVNKKFVSKPLSINSIKNAYLTRDQKDEIKKTLFMKNWN